MSMSIAAAGDGVILAAASSSAALSSSSSVSLKKRRRVPTVWLLPPISSLAVRLSRRKLLTPWFFLTAG
jgi:hypothetical protein